MGLAFWQSAGPLWMQELALGWNSWSRSLGQRPDLAVWAWRRNGSWLTGTRGAAAELSESAALCDAMFEILIKEKWAALVVTAIMGWNVLTLQCQGPCGLQWGNLFQDCVDPMWFLCGCGPQFYWSWCSMKHPRDLEHTENAILLAFLCLLIYMVSVS